MDVIRSLTAIIDAPDAGQESVRRAAKAMVEPGSLDVSKPVREAYGRDLAAARERIRGATTLDVSPPDELVLIDRHQWIDAAIDRQRTVYGGEAAEKDGFAETPPEQVGAIFDAGRFSVLWSTAAGHVVGWYDYTVLVAKATEPDGSVTVVHPNVDRASDLVDVDAARLRRWIVFNQTAYAVTLDAVPWLPEHLRANLLSRRDDDGGDHSGRNRWYCPFLLLNGYVQYILSRTFDDDVDTLQQSFHRDRWNRDLPTRLQGVTNALPSAGPLHELGRAFFEAVADARGPEAVDAVWEAEGTLPTWEELGGIPTERWRRAAERSGDVECSPDQWLDRVDP